MTENYKDYSAEKQERIDEAKRGVVYTNWDTLDRLAENVRARRELLNMTRAVLSEVSGVHTNLLYRIENGSNTQVTTVMLIADALGCSVADLFK